VSGIAATLAAFESGGVGEDLDVVSLDVGVEAAADAASPDIETALAGGFVSADVVIVALWVAAFTITDCSSELLPGRSGSVIGSMNSCA
jgi:hypothetical protein